MKISTQEGQRARIKQLAKTTYSCNSTNGSTNWSIMEDPQNTEELQRKAVPSV
jgi:hypothetical protein